MTPDGALIELLDRLAAACGEAVLVGEQELLEWPARAVAAMRSAGLLTMTAPAATLECPGCEEACVRQVHVVAHPDKPDAFIVCDSRGDINRVSVPSDRLAQWLASGASLAVALAGLLGLAPSASAGSDRARWQVGLLRGARHASHVVLVADDGLSLSVAGYSVPVTELLRLKGTALAADKRRLAALVDRPAAGGGDVESAAQRRERIKKRVEELRNKGVKAFLKTVAEEEGITVSRIKQILRPAPNPEPEPTKRPDRRR